MTFPTLKSAAEHLGAHPTALVTQFQRLERDIGAPLYHRAIPGRPLRPTRQGSSLLRILCRPRHSSPAPHRRPRTDNRHTA